MLSPELQQAVALHRSGRLEEAEAIYRRTMSVEADHPAVPHLLGVLSAQAGRLDEAHGLLRRATELQPNNVEVFSDLGSVTAMLGRFPEAESWLRKAIALKPGHVAAMASLAKVLQQQVRLSEAEACAKFVLKAAPNRIDMVNVIALGQYHQHKLTEAEETARKGLAAAPNDAELHNILGLILRGMHHLDDASAAFEKAMALRPNDVMPLYNLGVCHHQRDGHAAAEACFRKVLEKRPDYDDAKFALAEAIACQGRTAEGRALLDDVVARNSQHWMARWSRMLTFPVVYESEAQIDEVRADFDRQLTAFERDIDEPLKTDVKPLLAAVAYKTPFLLHYQGRNDVALQSRFGKIVTRIAEAAYPHYAKMPPWAGRPLGARIRIGFASSFLYSHSMTKTHGAWIGGLPRDSFDVTVFHLGTVVDQTTVELQRDTTWQACGTLSETELIATIAAAQLDVLIWLDIGMEQKAQIPAALRLAPVQATTLGHPMTTGFASMDYFLSSALMEPPDGDAHYTERLVRLPNLSVAYPQPPAQVGQAPAALTRLKSEGRILYLCAQSLFKLVPRNDALFAALAQKLPEADFVFVSHTQAAATDIFRTRIHKAFSAAGIDPGRIHILPRLSQEDFFAVNRAADVVLDSLSWAGFNSTMEALACDKPVVTLPGPTMRSRHAFGVLSMIDLSDLIARDEQDYVAIAARLGTDSAWRNEMVNRIVARKDALYEDPTLVPALSAWLEGAAAARG